MISNSSGDVPGPILVLGATGTTGRRVTARLRRRGFAVRPGSRAADPAFDWSDERTWQPVLNGVSAAYIAYYPDITAPGAFDAITRFAHTAVANGVERLVLISGRGEPESEAVEKGVIAASSQTTVVRCAFFAQDFSEKGFGFEEMIRFGAVALPAPEVGEAFVDAEDIADVVAEALADPRHAGKLYELTGPRLLTFRQAIAEIASATGRHIDYQQITPEQFVTGLLEQGVPEEGAAVFASIFETTLDGRNAHLADGVEQALGRPPRDFADFARDAAASGVWDLPHAGKLGASGV
ncbi:NmrA family NAD(P)-binding protein [Pseudonocardia sp. TRM90224]|uniref:NmrA family NAD(P)-binding protein n=1 Tax=Pseudonocardia sp. TRM90224 TaxID=2812678 RepID=UPI001E546EE8|nr:NmrA family NAD(P)-binding protein [Pseudonocardia sp. TRM90224]